jgi:hypothetical protein
VQRDPTHETLPVEVDMRAEPRKAALIRQESVHAVDEIVRPIAVRGADLERLGERVL